MGVNMNIIHEKSDVYCPYCLVALTRVKKTGHLFCNASLINCDYEVSSRSRAPLTLQQTQGLLKVRYSQQIKSLEKKVRHLNKQIVALNQKVSSIDLLESC